MVEELKDRIRNERIAKGLNQPELGKLMNVSKQTVSNWENGNRIPDSATVSKLADIFGVTVDYLLGRTKDRTSNNIPSVHTGLPKSEPELTVKDRKDIAKNLEDILNNIESVQGLEFYNQPQDEEDMEFIKRGLQTFLEDVKIYNKVKYNPNKYRGKK